METSITAKKAEEEGVTSTTTSAINLPLLLLSLVI
jgi:hypothetical protein